MSFLPCTNKDSLIEFIKFIKHPWQNNKDKLSIYKKHLKKIKPNCNDSIEYEFSEKPNDVDSSKDNS
jgi:hypothetical protein